MGSQLSQRFQWLWWWWATRGSSRHSSSWTTVRSTDSRLINGPHHLLLFSLESWREIRVRVTLLKVREVVCVAIHCQGRSPSVLLRLLMVHLVPRCGRRVTAIVLVTMSLLLLLLIPTTSSTPVSSSVLLL